MLSRDLHAGPGQIAVMSPMGEVSYRRPVSDIGFLREALDAHGYWIVGQLHLIRQFLNAITWTCAYKVILDGPNDLGAVGHPESEMIRVTKNTKLCDRCDGDGKAHGSDRPFEYSGPDSYPGKCPVCKGSGTV